MSDLPTLDWEPNEDGGWKADIGILWFAIDDSPLTLTVGWRDDYEAEIVESFEHGKRRALELGRLILQQGIDTLARSKP